MVPLKYIKPDQWSSNKYRPPYTITDLLANQAIELQYDLVSFELDEETSEINEWTVELTRVFAI